MKKIIIKVVDVIMAVIATAVISVILGACACMCAAHAFGETQKQGNTLVITKAEKGAKTATAYTVKVNGKEYRIFKGPRGGYFYEKDGKKVYLTKKQREIMGL